MTELDRCYKVLELEPGASLDEVNQAYKDLAFIWHPDRIPQDNPRLQQKAQEKLKQINQARDILRAAKASFNGKKVESSQARSPHPSQPSYHYKSSQQHHQQPPASHHSQSYYYKSSQQHYQQPPASNHSQSPPKSPYPDMSGADLRGANLREKDLSNRNLSNANLSDANLSDAFLHKINLQGANLEKANLFRANLLQANLRNANLKSANLIGADFSGADLSGANLTGANVGSNDRLMVKFTGAKLTGTIMPNGTIHS